MSYDQLSSLEAGRSGRDNYTDDPEFKQLKTDLKNKINNLRRNIQQLTSDVNALGTKRDNARVRERVRDYLEKTRDLCKEIGEGVKKLQTWDDLTKQQKYDQSRVSTDFQNALQEFQDIQRKALEKQRASVTAARAAQDGDGADAPAGTEGRLEQLQEQEVVRLASQDEVDFQEALIVEREDEIRNIEQGVGDLNVLFRQVAQIVSEQGEQLTSIADNVEDTRDNTRGAQVELRQAAKHQKAARSKACCLLLILSVILTIILLAIFLD
ncbi:Syntaxin pep12 [Colletotrichum sidae]|uniref:Syntaxin pep12 n=4 Tax=Colletotrichum orbiculare species complex TaxID=2707354 RepID=N4W2Z3_COLOR|nr:Syntaxin pep12 [Colletotrichum orbiculare MAFF 240422]TDZ31215.1 Syntaxin pep12 [Colletotrichum spinosum]TDZ58482.1 Syntaxin pep12 [Colletotrichum trifolii]TEA20109.1 Syntaxin pep12 [Colletotrichum sidae]